MRDILQRFDEDTTLQHIFSVEPTVRDIIIRTMNLKPGPDYSWTSALEAAQAEIKYLVGWYARDKRVAHSKYYAAVMDTLREVIPPNLDESVN